MKLPDPADTITAQATPPGAGAIAVLRLSGPAAFAAAAGFLSPKPDKPAHRRAYLLSALDGERLVDRVIAVFFKGPASYTGQDTVEISCHGSPYITRTLLNLAVKNGARVAAPGEFTLRAFLNGKLDLAQAEAVGDLITSSSAGAHRAAITQAEGDTSARVREIRAPLITLLAQLEARLDDSYEEMPALDLRDFATRAAVAQKLISELAARYEAGKAVRDGLGVVIAGAPNSGKSSLLNALLGYDRALVSRAAGTTRDTLEAELEIDGFTVRLTDTAGLNAQKPAALERAGMRRARKALAAADLVLLVRDASVTETQSDRRAWREARASKAGIIEVYNKADLPRRRVPAPGGFMVSCRSGQGLDRLRRALVARQKKVFSDGAQAAVISARHFEALSGAAGELAAMRALLKARKNPPLELAAERLRLALGKLALILGETAPEEVLADIFAKFCVGK